MNGMTYTIKQDPDALDLTNRPQHLLSPSIENDDDEEYLHSDDEQHHDNIQETTDFINKVCLLFLFIQLFHSQIFLFIENNL